MRRRRPFAASRAWYRGPDWLSIRDRPGRWRLTLAGLAVSFVFAAVGSGALRKLIDQPPSLPVLGRYLLLFGPMSAGLTLQCFYLVPSLVLAHRDDWPGLLLGAGAVLVVVGLAWWRHRAITCRASGEKP